MWFWRLVAVCLMVSLTGCGERRGLAPVSGTIHYNGKPLANAYVGFVPEEQGARSASGTTDENGQYRLTTFESYDGARVGKHGVTVSVTEKPAKPVMPDGAVPQVGNRPGKPPERKLLTPARYARPETSGLAAEVVAGKKNVFDFELKD